MKSKLPNTGTTIFSVMSKMAAEYNAINLSQGFPNFPVDPALEECLERAVRSGHHQYAPMPGNTRLLEGIAGLVHREYGRYPDPSAEILVTAGATEGIFVAIQALVNTGDEVLILDPAYDCYDPAVILAGGRPVHLNMREDFTINWQELREVLSQRTRLLILNNPHNPSGKIFSAEDEAELLSLMHHFPNLVLLSDEVYEFISFGGEHRSVHLHPDIFDRSIVVSSFGKTFHITGWKIGYLIAGAAIMKELKKVHQFLVFSVNSIAQQALSEYIGKAGVTALAPFYREKKEYFARLLENSGFDLLPCEGTYFQTARYNRISGLRDTEFCEWLAKEAGVAAIPLSPFFADGTDYKTIRFCFAKTEEMLDQAAERLCRI